MKKIIKKLLKTVFVIGTVFGAFFLLFYLLTLDEYLVPKTVAQDPSISHVTINGIVFHSETFGDPKNPVVIVVHGGPGWDYRSLLPLRTLADKYFVVFYDQRGTGLSPRVSSEELSLESSLSDLNAIVDYFSNGRKVKLVGHSWGAMLVSSYIGKHPDKVDRVVLAEPGFLTTEMVKEAGISFGPKFDLRLMLRASKIWFQSLHVKNSDQYASSDYFLGEIAPYANPEYYCSGIITEVGAEHWRVGSQAMQSVMRSIMDSEGNMRSNLIEGIDKYTDEVLFIASECNTKIGVEYQRKQMKYFSNAKLAVIKGSGHMMFAEKTSDSIAVVRKYLNSR